jgi:hypothetical protein
LPTTPSDADIAQVIRALLLRRGPGKTICPSEAARTLSADWRSLMPEVRRVAAGLKDVEITQKGVVVVLPEARGPIRLRLAQDPG